MKYFLKVINIKRGKYLQIYRSYYVPEVKGSRNACYKSLGYEEDLIQKGIPDPEAYFRDKIEKMNAEIEANECLHVGKTSARKFAGHFLLNSVFNILDMGPDMRLLATRENFGFEIEDFIKAAVAARVTAPFLRNSSLEDAISSLYGVPEFSAEEISGAVRYLGSNYQKFIELINRHAGHVFRRSHSVCYFSSANYRFMADPEKYDRPGGETDKAESPSVTGQALVLDGKGIPFDMTIYREIQSEKKYVNDITDDLKNRFEARGRIVRVTDKGCNLAKGIYAAAVEAKDGYIFSRPVYEENPGREEESRLILTDGDKNSWTAVLDAGGEMKYRYRQCTGAFKYRLKSDENGGHEIVFEVKEKRIIIYDPALAEKQKDEAYEKAGDDIPAENDAGYFMLVSSETEKDAKDICDAYYANFEAKESFGIVKELLKEDSSCINDYESVCGHFLISYYALTVLKLLETKIFKNKLSLKQILDFIGDYTISPQEYGGFTNNSADGETLDLIKKTYKLPKISNLYLKEKDLDCFMSVKPII